MFISIIPALLLLPELIVFFHWYGTTNGMTLTLYSDFLSTVYINTWTVTTGWLRRTAITYTALQSIPLSGTVPIFSWWFIRLSIGYQDLAKFAFLGLGALMFFLAWNQKSRKFAFIGMILVIFGMIIVFGGALFELKSAVMIISGFYAIMLGRTQKDTRYTILGISLVLTTILAYMVFWQLSQIIIVL